MSDSEYYADTSGMMDYEADDVTVGDRDRNEFSTLPGGHSPSADASAAAPAEESIPANAPHEREDSVADTTPHATLEPRDSNKVKVAHHEMSAPREEQDSAYDEGRETNGMVDEGEYEEESEVMAIARETAVTLDQKLQSIRGWASKLLQEVTIYVKATEEVKQEYLRIQRLEQEESNRLDQVEPAVKGATSHLLDYPTLRAVETGESNEEDQGAHGQNSRGGHQEQYA